MEFTIEEKAELINLAMQIEIGAISLISVLQQIKKYPELWSDILKFWSEFNEMTRKVIELISLELNYVGAENV